MTDIDGKKIASEVRAEVRIRAEAFQALHGRAPRLEVILVGDDPASQVYVRNKERAAKEASIAGSVTRLPETTKEDELLARIRDFNQDSTVDGILVQLPVPDHIHSLRVIDALSPDKDVDGLHPQNAGMLWVGRGGLRPCTPLGCIRLLESTGVNLSGKKAVVVGRSNLVGKPIAAMLLEANCTVEIAHSKTTNLAESVARADIVIAAVGRPEMVRGGWIKSGAIVIDVGINRLADGRLVGDVDYSEASKRAAFITPVPGGVGPMTIAMLLSNTVDAANGRVGTKAR